MREPRPIAHRTARSALAPACAAAIIGALVACSSAPPVPPDHLLDPPARTGRSSSKGDSGSAVLDSADASVPDAAPVCETAPPTNRCGLAPQCGCATNETCDVTNGETGATSCVTAGGATLGRPCAQTGDCVAGLTCLYGACRPYCKTPRTKCNSPGTELCVELLDEDEKPEPNMATCTITCDPRAPQAVCGTNACLWFPDYYSPSKVSDCNYPGTVQPYNECTRNDDCQAGFACVLHPGLGYRECERWCRLGSNADCPDQPKNLECKDVFGAAAPEIGGVKEGVCQDDLG